MANVTVSVSVPASLAEAIRAHVAGTGSTVSGFLVKLASDALAWAPDETIEFLIRSHYVMRPAFVSADPDPWHETGPDGVRRPRVVLDDRANCIRALVESTHLDEAAATARVDRLDWSPKARPRAEEPNPERDARDRARSFDVIDARRALANGEHPLALRDSLMSPGPKRSTGWTLAEAEAIIAEAQAQPA